MKLDTYTIRHILNSSLSRIYFSYNVIQCVHPSINNILGYINLSLFSTSKNMLKKNAYFLYSFVLLNLNCFFNIHVESKVMSLNFLET